MIYAPRSPTIRPYYRHRNHCDGLYTGDPNDVGITGTDGPPHGAGGELNMCDPPILVPWDSTLWGINQDVYDEGTRYDSRYENPSPQGNRAARRRMKSANNQRNWNKNNGNN